MLFIRYILFIGYISCLGNILFMVYTIYRNFKSLNILGLKNYELFSISIPKCIELNSESVLSLGLGTIR